MTRIMTDEPTIEQLKAFAETVTELTTWDGDKFGIKLNEVLEYALDGLKIRDDLIAYGKAHDEGLDEPILTDPMEERVSDVVKLFATDMVMMNGVYVSVEPKRTTPHQNY